MLSSYLFRLLCFGSLLLNVSCYQPWSRSYQEFYQHLQQSYPKGKMQETDYFLVILVDARHLDYTDNRSFFRTVAKHPSDGSKNGDFGHAWIYLEGWMGEERVIIEGGHSGERGLLQAKYFDGIMNYNEWGYANPTVKDKCCPKYEPNPAKYLWASQEDGFFQQGAGGHTPTFAVKINLSKEQFQHILTFIHPYNYPYQQYALSRHQCSSFVAEVANLANFYFDYEISMPIEPKVWFRGCWIRFWEDPQYSLFTFASPDVIEKSLIEAVREERVEYALDWYKQRQKNN